jgi:hypothetical protein
MAEGGRVENGVRRFDVAGAVEAGQAGFAPGMSAQDVVNSYGIQNIEQAQQVAQALGYTGDLSGLTYGTTAPASAPASVPNTVAPPTDYGFGASPSSITGAQILANDSQGQPVNLSLPGETQFAANTYTQPSVMDNTIISYLQDNNLIGPGGKYDAAGIAAAEKANHVSDAQVQQALKDYNNSYFAKQAEALFARINPTATTPVAPVVPVAPTIKTITPAPAIIPTPTPTLAPTSTTPTNANLNTVILPNGKTVTLNPTNLTTANVLAPTNINTAPANTLASGVSGTTGASQIGGGAMINPNGTITESPRLPDIPIGGFNSIQQLMDATTKRGDSLGFVPKAPSTIDEFNQSFNKLSGQSKASFEHLMGGADTPVPYTKDNQIMKPYWDQMAGTSASTTPDASTRWYFDPITHKVVENLNYKAPDLTSSGTKGMVGSTITIPNVGKAMYDANSGYYYINGKYYDKDGKLVDYTGEFKTGGLMAMANGGMSNGDLGGYSDGGRLLRGPGDGVSDSIPATIANKRPARLADGEFVVPARIVSELGNGSTEAGAKQLYAMMDRIQQARSKTVGKGRVATNSRSAKYLPA